MKLWSENETEYLQILYKKKVFEQNEAQWLLRPTNNMGFDLSKNWTSLTWSTFYSSKVQMKHSLYAIILKGFVD